MHDAVRTVAWPWNVNERNSNERETFVAQRKKLTTNAVTLLAARCRTFHRFISPQFVVCFVDEKTYNKIALTVCLQEIQFVFLFDNMLRWKKNQNIWNCKKVLWLRTLKDKKKKKKKWVNWSLCEVKNSFSMVLTTREIKEILGKKH